MNITDVKDPIVPESYGDMAATIFERQSMLEDHYSKIEGRPKEIMINSRQGQVIIKDFLWRITEELGEAFEAEAPEGIEKVWEELSDALHFVTSIGVMTNNFCAYQAAWETAFSDPSINLVYRTENLIMELGKLGNCLKLKPWKQTDVETDTGYFNEVYYRVVKEFLNFCRSYEMSSEDIYKTYYKKSEVNWFRIRSKY